MTTIKGITRKAFYMFILFLVTGCAGPSPLKMTILPLSKPIPDVAINLSVLAKIQSIAVLPFDNSDKSQLTALPSPPFPNGTFRQMYPYQNDGEVIADRITTYLVKSFQFKMIDRIYVKDILNEQAFQLSGVVNERKAVQIGKLVAADAILFGKVNSCRYLVQSIHRGGDGMALPLAVLNVDFKLIHVETGEIGVIAHHELCSEHLMDVPVDMLNTNILKRSHLIPTLDQVIMNVIDETLQPVIASKRSLKAF